MGGGGLARARGERDTREKAEEKLFIPSFLPSSRAARRACALRPALEASQQ